MDFSRITSTPHQCSGAPCLRSLRIPVAAVVEMVGDGMTIDGILAAFTDLVAEDVEEALRYATATVQDGGRPAGDPQSGRG